MEKVNFTAFDFETATYDRMPCQLGLVVVRKGEIVEERMFLIKPPENRYDTGCERIHGISPKETETCQEFDQLWDEIKPYFEHELLVAHNVDFDIGVLDKILKFYNLHKVRPLCFYDTMYLFDNCKRSLSDITYALGIIMEKHHDALSDARACAQIYIEYLKGIDVSKLSFPVKSGSKVREQKTNTLTIEDLEWIEINESADDFFKNKRAVISGEYECYPNRDELKLLLENYGVTFSSGISAKTNLFIVGSKFGPKKMEKVLDLNKSGCDIKVLPENQLYQLLKSLK